MFVKILLFIYFMGVSKAVFIDPVENLRKDLNKESPQGWQMVKVYHPPNSQAFGYKYEPYAYPKYEFEYSVSDKKTGDHKRHHEARDGDRVRGEYSLVESDGSLRKVQYHADDHNGFNAIVSKTVNKHGDHAVSVTDHTRFFYPVGHGVKINHYFPGKNYHSQHIENPKLNEVTIPVHEEKETTVTRNEETKMVLIDTGDKIMIVEPEISKNNVNIDQIENFSPTPKAEEVEPVTLKVVPATVSMIAQNVETNKFETDSSSSPAIEKTEILPSKESALPLPSKIEDQTTEKEEQQSDSEVASSFYHSKFYYIGY